MELPFPAAHAVGVHPVVTPVPALAGINNIKI